MAGPPLPLLVVLCIVSLLLVPRFVIRQRAKTKKAMKICKHLLALLPLFLIFAVKLSDRVLHRHVRRRASFVPRASRNVPWCLLMLLCTLLLMLRYRPVYGSAAGSWT